MLGLELEDARAVAVRVDDRGAVLARAVVEADGDLAAAATAALEQVTAGDAGARVLGVATVNPESPAMVAVVAGLAHHFAGPFAQNGATPSGMAAAVAEAWVGAGRGAHDVVFFAVGVHTTGGIVRGTAKYLGMAAANLVVVADPGTLVLGGIMASAADLLLDPLRVEIARRLPKSMLEALTIEAATLGADAAAIGAARLASAAVP